MICLGRPNLLEEIVLFHVTLDTRVRLSTNVRGAVTDLFWRNLE